MAFLLPYPRNWRNSARPRAKAVESLIALSGHRRWIGKPVSRAIPWKRSDERILVGPGADRPDGTVTQGSSYERSITGESVPVPGGGQPGAEPQPGRSLEIRVDKRAGDSTIARVIELVEDRPGAPRSSTADRSPGFTRRPSSPGRCWRWRRLCWEVLGRYGSTAPWCCCSSHAPARW